MEVWHSHALVQSTLLGSFSWLVPRRTIKAIRELKNLHVVIPVME
jgi:hypothetical protein